MKKPSLLWFVCAFLLFTNIASLVYIGKNGWIPQRYTDLTEPGETGGTGLIFLEETVPSKPASDTSAPITVTEGALTAEYSDKPKAEPTTVGTENVPNQPVTTSGVLQSTATETERTALPYPTSSVLSFLEVTKNVKAGSKATVTVLGKPGESYSITVRYKSGPSTASGLVEKAADADGKVTWTWTVGSKTTEGTYPITVSGGGETVETTFTVSKKN